MASYFDLNHHNKKDLYELIEAMKLHLDEFFKPAGYNLGNNLGQDAGQTVMHVHMHLIPLNNGGILRI